jgi:hypothetical protein
VAIELGAIVLEGLLRRSISVGERDDAVSLVHPCWQLELPGEWFYSIRGSREFLAGRMTAYELKDSNPQCSGLVDLLRSQGCLTFSADTEVYSLLEVKRLFTAVRNEWYGVYYRHPIWAMLRKGELSRNGLLTWLIYNYFLSRSAGNSSARFATRAPASSKLRSQFYRETLEEYSHFSDYYFVRHSQVALSDDAVDSYVQVPSSLAFCQQMMRMAESEWLSYLLISFFQESTVSFSEDCRNFYKQVEASYGMPKLFDPWWKHIELDIEFCHARNLEDMFEGDTELPAAHVIRSLTSAWIAFRFLCSSLDEILVHGQYRPDVCLRQPVADGLAGLFTNALARSPISLLKRSTHLPRTGSLLDVHLALRSCLPNPEQFHAVTPNRDDMAFLRRDLIQSVYRAMSYAETGRELMVIGGLAERAFRRLPEFEQDTIGDELMPATAEAMALANFVRELSTRPKELCFALLSLIEYEPEWALIFGSTCEDLTGLLAASDLDPTLAKRTATQRLQLIEFYANWRKASHAVDIHSFFWGSPADSSSALAIRYGGGA